MIPRKQQLPARNIPQDVKDSLEDVIRLLYELQLYTQRPWWMWHRGAIAHFAKRHYRGAVRVSRNA